MSGINLNVQTLQPVHTLPLNPHSKGVAFLHPNQRQKGDSEQSGSSVSEAKLPKSAEMSHANHPLKPPEESILPIHSTVQFIQERTAST